MGAALELNFDRQRFGRSTSLHHSCSLKWVESEKAGHDIGFEHALLDWIIKRRSAWREHRKEQLKAEEFPIPNSSTQPPRF
jgi:hypothetical protein